MTVKGGIHLLLLLSLFFLEIQATRNEILNFKEIARHGMYSKQAIPGSKIQPKFTIKLSGIVESEFTYLIYEYKDRNMIGYRDSTAVHEICTADLKNENKCFDNIEGEFIINNTMANSSHILNVFFKNDNDVEADYPVDTTGLYFVRFHNKSFVNYTSGSLAIDSPYGDLPAEKYPYLPFYGFVGLTYLVVGIIWLVLSGCYWREILPVQNYISGIIFLCMVEMTFQYAYYATWNDRGSSSTGLQVITVILTSLRHSASFVALLVICMGYGLVKPTLGSTAHKILGLGFCHFAFGTLFSSSSIRPGKSEKLLALMFVFPLAITLTLFYTWTFNSLNITIKKLEIRRQSKKTLVYRRLWRLLMVSLVVLLVFVVLTIIQGYDTTYHDEHWDTMWFTTEGWIELLYFFMFISIIFLWRPQKNNRRLGMTEVPADDEDDDAMVSAGGANKVKMRALKKKGKAESDDDEEDALKWVEENLSEPEDLDPLSLAEENEEKIARRELAKMN